MSGKAPMPWVRLWREEKGSFAQLPLYCRALAAELLKIVDDDGRIGLGGRNAADAVAFALGADRGDRRLLRRHIPMLIQDGYLALSEGALMVVNWDRWQAEAITGRARTGNEPATTEPRPRNDRTTTAQRPNHDRATTEPRPRNESAAKSPESRAPDRQEGEKRREEEEGTPRPPLGRVTEHDLFSGYRARWSHRFPDAVPDGRSYDPQNTFDAAAWRDLLLKVREQARLVSKTEREVAETVLDALFDDEWAAERQFPPKLMVSRFAKFAARVTSGKSRPRGGAELVRLDAELDVAQQRGDWDAVDRIRAEIDALSRRRRSA